MRRAVPVTATQNSGCCSPNSYSVRAARHTPDTAPAIYGVGRSRRGVTLCQP
jgi:hypothetical protein